MANTTETVAVERALVIAASPETVWELLVDPEKAGLWMGLQIWSEPREGGMYRVEVIPGQIARGEFVELDPPRRLVHTWGWEGDDNPVPPGSTTIEYELTPEGDGTLLRVVHSGLPTAESAASHPQSGCSRSGTTATRLETWLRPPPPTSRPASAQPS